MGGWFELGTLALPELRSFGVRQSSIRPVNLAALAAAQLPQLERLSLGAGAYDNHEPYAIADHTSATLADLASPLRFPKLRDLGLVSTLDTSASIERLVRSPAALARREAFDVRHNLLTADDTRQLASVLPNAAQLHAASLRRVPGMTRALGVLMRRTDGASRWRHHARSRLAALRRASHLHDGTRHHDAAETEISRSRRVVR